VLTTCVADTNGCLAFNAGSACASGTCQDATTCAPPLDHLSIATISTQHSGTAFVVTITAEAADNSTTTWFTGTVDLTVSSGSVTPLTSAAFVGGVLTQSVTITGPYTTAQTLTATQSGGSATGTSNAFTLNHFHGTGLALNDGSPTPSVGGIRNGDQVVLTFSEAANPASVTSCGLSINDGGLLADTVTGTSIGTIDLGNTGYATANRAAATSICTWSAGNTVLTITMAGITAPGTTLHFVPGGSTATWFPVAGPTSATGEALDTAQHPSVTGVLF
jgi:hypothetical protein